jgi:hypothetical protein
MRTQMHSRATRLARGWVVGVFATALAASSHALAGGGTPSGLALVVGVVFGGMLGTFALSARPSLPRLAIAVVGSQFAFHVAFSTLGAAAPVAADHTHGTVTMAAPTMTAHAHTDSPAMWLSHAAAGLLTLALLRGAERAAWRVLTEFARLVVSPFLVISVTPIPARRTPVVSTDPARLASRLLDRAVSRRGPPLSVAF